MKNVQYKVILTKREYQLLHCMMEFRNRVIQRDGPTEDIDGILLKLFYQKRRWLFFRIAHVLKRGCMAQC